MAITSSDIQNQSFSIDRKGYDVDEVDVFLERVANEVDEMNATIIQLENEIDDDKLAGFDKPARGVDSGVDKAELAKKDARITDLERELEEKKANDNAIAQALIIAQRSADEIIDNANHDAAQIRRDAEEEAQRIVDKADNERQRIIDDIQKLEVDREDSREEYQDLLKDFINDASKKLSNLGIPVSTSSSSAHARKSGSDRGTKNQSPIRKTVSATTATYTTPQPSTAAIAPTTPKPSKVEKDFSGFGDADDTFEFGDVD